MGTHCGDAAMMQDLIKEYPIIGYSVLFVFNAVLGWIFRSTVIAQFNWFMAVCIGAYLVDLIFKDTLIGRVVAAILGAVGIITLILAFGKRTKTDDAHHY
jgi:hypothetical protein